MTIQKVNSEPESRRLGRGRMPPEVNLPLDMLALGLLMHGPSHGYRLYSDYQQTLATIWMVGRSRFYAALAGLPALGLARKRLEPQSGRPSRSVYSITAAGRERFLTWIYQPVTPMRAVRAEFLAKLRLMGYLGLPNLRRLVAAQKRAARAALAELKLAAAQSKRGGGHDFDEILFAFRVHQGRAVLEWLSLVERHSAEGRRNPRHAVR
jgi:DNA-binding PadR family transcriptional regulator